MGFFKSILLASVLLMPVLTEASVSTLVADTKSGLILASKNATEQQYPASLTKVMTLYMTFSAIERGILKMEDRLPVSLKAAKQPRSKLYVRPGQTISVRDAIMALIIKSANDVAVVLAEALAPSEEEFARMMTKTARNLGLHNTTFKNASGLHNPDQVTTAQDMAILTMAMIHHFPQYYKLFSKKSFTYNGRVYRSHNHVQKRYAGAEGLKTGYISAVGYNIISTAKRNDDRLVSVVIGGDTVAQRDKQAMRLLDNGFSKINQHKNQKDKQNLLSKKALLQKPDLTSELKIMANRLDKVIQSNSPINRVSLLKLNPFGTKQAIAAESLTSIENKIPEQGSTYEDDFSEVKKDIIYQPVSETNIEPIQGQDTPVQIENEPQVIIEEVKSMPKSEQPVVITPQRNEPQAVINALVPKKIKNDEMPLNQGIQVGAFRTTDAAFKQAKRAAQILNIPETNIHTPEALPLIRARLYGFKNREEAKNACQTLKKHYMNCIALPSGQ
ncbi:MAG: D-alanyl-D-alanine carboxypeptidase [Alphaproteobacteria bacterium]|nr:D-alanyl-D-alanine carboxypeptidase [Alphaproteobacteria bacterium]